jgi:hypothetical protein
MGKCSTFLYVIDSKPGSNNSYFNNLEGFIEESDQFLSSFFKEKEFTVDDNLVNKILSVLK